MAPVNRSIFILGVFNMKKRTIFPLLFAALLGICLLCTFVACRQDEQQDPSKQTDDACTHEWQDTELRQAATCTEAGNQEQKCAKCGETRTVTISALGHLFDETMAKDQTAHWFACTHEGCHEVKDKGTHDYENGLCKVCGGYDMRYTDGLTIAYNEGDKLFAWSDTYYVSGYNGTESKVSLPYYYDDGIHGVRPVEAIGENVFANNTIVTELVVPDTILKISYTAFSGSAWLAAQEDGVVYVGKVAYMYKGEMPKDYSLVLKSGTLSIAEWAFNSDSNLKSVTIPDSVTLIDRYAFQNCRSLETLTIGNSVQIIARAAFGDCVALREVSIPDSVKVLRAEAFYRCSQLTTVTIGSGIEDVYPDVFQGDQNLTSIQVRCTVAQLKAATEDDTSWYRDCHENLVITCSDGRFQ